MISSGFFFNTTWEGGRGQVLPDVEFFPWVLSFFLEFWEFLLSFGKNITLFPKNLKILTNHGKFYHFFLFLKIFVNKNGVKSATPLKILSFDEKVSWNLVFFLSFANGRESPPKGWVFFLSFLLEFCPWVLVFSAGGVKKSLG